MEKENTTITQTTTQETSQGLGDKVMPTADGAGLVAETMRDGLNEKANVTTETSVKESVNVEK